MPADHLRDRKHRRGGGQEGLAGDRLKRPFRKDFFAELRALGVPLALCARLRRFLRLRHPGDQEKIYHSLAHTYEVAGVTARMLHGWPKVPKERKVLLILAAALHDVDPARKPGTPARVGATLKHLTRDREAHALLKDFEERFWFTDKQVLALVMATDYSAHPEESRAKNAAFQRAHRRAFPRDPWIAEWGRRLAYWDRVATYVQMSPEDARRRIAGLGRELRALGVRPSNGLKGTSIQFLSKLRSDPLFHYFSARERARFDALMRSLR